LWKSMRNDIEQDLFFMNCMMMKRYTIHRGR
jgi:hypothetical protein